MLCRASEIRHTLCQGLEGPSLSANLHQQVANLGIVRRAQVSPLAVAAGRGDGAVEVGVGVGVVEEVCIVLHLVPKIGVQVLVVFDVWGGGVLQASKGVAPHHFGKGGGVPLTR